MKLILKLSIFIPLFINISCNKPVPGPVNIKVKISDTLYGRIISGKLIFLYSKDTSAYLVFGVDPQNPHPVFTYDIEDWNPEDTIFINQFNDEWYKKFTDLKGEYACRVILDINNEERSSFVAGGNGYSKRLKQFIDPSEQTVTLFEINNKFDGWSFTESETIKEVKVRSELLSDFWKKDIFIQSAVILPKDFNPENNDYKVVYVFPGFGSSHASITYGTGQIDRYGMNTTGRPKVFVFMNGEFFQGYHHFADSENNGPWGTAFIREFIPFIEHKYGLENDNLKRFLMGQSSGAWTALWLQISYPGYFEHTFAASPDPVDFRVQGYNIYKRKSNYYYPENADSSGIAEGDNTKLYARLEDVLGEFGQVRSWEATFSPKTAEGDIAQLFDRGSGNINPETADKWKRYDISRIILNDPEKYGPIVTKKVHIFVSTDDPYGLNKSIELFNDELKKLNMEADINYYEGLGHNVWIGKMREYIHNIIDGTE